MGQIKQLKGPKPHSQRDAEAAVGLGVDNGKPLGRDPRKLNGGGVEAMAME